MRVSRSLRMPPSNCIAVSIEDTARIRLVDSSMPMISIIYAYCLNESKGRGGLDEFPFELTDEPGQTDSVTLVSHGRECRR